MALIILPRQNAALAPLPPLHRVRRRHLTGVTILADTDFALPLLDLRRLDGDQASRAAFLAEFRAAAHDVGFFYLAGHGVDPALEAEVVAETNRFFALPEADKLAVQMVHSPHFRGYNRAGQELTRGKQDWREQFDVHAERESWPQNRPMVGQTAGG